jgi:FG-GAP-like repeat/FG-GAP repeat
VDVSFVERPVPFVSGARHWSVGDFDGDGNLDVLLNLDVRRGGGDGTFGPLVTPTPCSPCSALFDAIAVTDLNDDGRSDVIVGYPFELVVLLGQTNGSLAEASRHSLPSATQITAGHLDDDGHLDLAVTGVSSRLELLFGDGAGSFAERQSYENTRTTYAPLLVEDHDGDGLCDVVLDGRWVAYGRGQRRIRAPEYSELTPAGPSAPAIVDRVKGGAQDVASALRDAQLHLLPFGLNRYLRPAEVCNGPGTGAERKVADFTGDGLVDVASFIGDLSLWVGQGGCQFAAATPHPYAGVLSWFRRIDGDELSDVLYWTKGGFGIALATAPGVFGAPVLSPFSRWPYTVAAADFNGDGELDVVTAGHEDLVITVLLGKDLVLTEADEFDFSASEQPYLQAADIDGDGDTDVLMGVMGSGPSHIDILRNDGSATFTRERLTDADINAGYTVADLDADGKLELVVDHDQLTLAVYRVGTSGPAHLLMKLAMQRGVEAHDVDGDGDLELVSMQAGFVGVANNLTFD